MKKFLNKIGLGKYKIPTNLYFNTIVPDCFGLSHGELSENEVIGIIDAESFKNYFFTDEKIIQITKACMDLATAL